MPIAPFTTVYNHFDAAVTAVLVTGTSNMIAKITPLFVACFGLYVALIVYSYMRGNADIIDDMQDWFYRMIGWGAIIVYGLNVDSYNAHVAPFVTGLGDDLATVFPGVDAKTALDAMANAFIDAFIDMYNAADGFKQTMFAVIAIVAVAIFGGIFMAIAIAYIILAKVALGILVAIGPLFIACAMFPASRDLFKNWTAQVLNYSFLVLLFSFGAQIEIALMQTQVPAPGAGLTISSVFNISLLSFVMIFVSLNLPAIAAALAGGIGISTMFRKIPKLGVPKIPGFGGGKGGGSASPATSNPGGSVGPERK
jgi:type IV secretion system protein VirB6